MAETLEDVLFAVILLLLLSRVVGILARRFGVANLVGNVMAGVLLGPVLIFLARPLGLQWGMRPSEPMAVFADFGIIILMLFTGLETDFHTFRQVKRASVVVGIGGVLVTFALLLASLLALGLDLNVSLFIAALLSNTAIEVSAGILHRFPESQLKAVVIGASFVDDIVAVMLLGIVSSLIFVGGPDVADISLIAVKLVLFLVASLVLFAWVLDRLLDRLMRRGDNLLLTTTLIVALAFALLAGELGLHPVIGAYVAGFVIGRWGSRPDPMLEHSIARGRLLREIEAPLNAFFAPFFFGYVGLMFVTVGEPDWAHIVGLVVVLTALALAGKILGCGIGARMTGFSRREGFVIGLAMGGRGALEIVLLRFGLDTGVMTATEFTTVVVVILLTVVLSPILFGRGARALLGRSRE